MLGGLRWFQTYVPRLLVLQLIGPGADRAQSEERERDRAVHRHRRLHGVAGRPPAPQLAEFLNRHFGLLAGCIDAEQGTVDKYIGDFVMAFWGAPACRPTTRRGPAAPPRRSRQAARGQPAPHGGQRPVRLRIGIHSGPAVVGNVGAPGRINYTPIGDTVHTSQRLEQLGKQVDTAPATVVVLIGARPRACLDDTFSLQPLGEQELRGRSESLVVFRLL